MACDSNCGQSPCTSKQANISTSNLIVNPPNPTVGSNFSITVDVTNNNVLQNSFVDVCIFDRDTGRCLYDSGFNWFSPITTSTIGPITLTMPNYPYHLQVATREQQLYQLLYYCGDYQDITVIPYNPPGTTYGCNPSTGHCEPGYGNYTDPNCNGTCGGGGGGFGTCSPACTSSDMCVLGACIPKPLVFVGIAGFLFMMMSGGRR